MHELARQLVNTIRSALAGHSIVCALSVRDIEQLITECETAALAVNTQRTYRTGWNSWTRWATEHRARILPAKPKDLQRWLATLLAQGKAPSTLRTYLAAVAHRHRDCARANPAQDPKVRQLLKGLIRRSIQQGRRARQSAPIRWNHVRQIIVTARIPRRNQPGGRQETLQQAQYRARIDTAMLTLAHDAALRSGELRALTWADLYTSQHSKCGLVEIRRSKTDQTGQGTTVPISQVCLKALIRLKPYDVDPNSRIFDMSANTVTRRVKFAARAAGIDPTNITSHSPRIGLAQDLAAQDISMPALMRAGRWKSPTVAAHYTQHLTALHTPGAQYLQTQQAQND